MLSLCACISFVNTKPPMIDNNGIGLSANQVGLDKSFFVMGSEDDGYLVNIVWDKLSKKSSLEIFDAKTMDAAPIAFIELPRRVPGGFHSRFVH